MSETIGQRAPVSIIVPTYREAQNLPELIRRLTAACAAADLPAEIIIVDDNSQDGTEEAVAELAREHAVRLLVRTTERGLSSAVLAGFAEATHERFVVLDADLQHPPEMVPQLVARLDDGCDFVIGTRYAKGGRIVEDWPWHRRLASSVATALARPLAPLTDPMSGFFALPRAAWERATDVNPIGYKIALELCVKARCTNVGEVPIEFATRHAGESKMSLRVDLAYLAHLAHLYYHRSPALAGGALLVAVALVVMFVKKVIL
jgi:dolichol-phosphate mannosyltransferase